MDTNTTLIIIVAILALIAIIAFFRFSRSSQVKLKGPLGTGLDLKAHNDVAPITPAATLKDAQSGGNVTVSDETGRGATGEQIKSKGDISVRSKNSDPKV
jgi:hypothetical protein